MSLETLSEFNWSVMTPEFIILGVIALLTLLDLFMPKRIDRRILGWLSIAGIIAAMAALFSLLGTEPTSILYDTFTLDMFGKSFKLLLLAGAGLVMFLAVSYDAKEGMEDYRGEFYYLFLTALLGAMFMTSSGDLITLFIGLELLSISSYILAGIKKHNLKSNESAMKYVINGSIATAITLFGMSYVYGLTGSTNLAEIANKLSAVVDGQHTYLLGLAFLMIFVGLSFKLASAPFHMWAPDVYQGAPTPVTAFLSVVSKTAGFVIVIRILISVFFNAAPSGDGGSILFKMHDYLAFLAAVTMIIGNVVALKQTNIKRMFAYSSIAHAGYLLVALTTLSANLIFSVWFYLLAYMLMNLGAFAVIQVVTEKTGSAEIADFAGLYRRSPVLAVTMGILLVSLAGFPGTAGFIGKLNIFVGAFYGEPHYVLASIMIATTVVSYFYYFGVMTQMFFRPAREESKFNLPFGIIVVLIVAVVGSVLFGVAPNIALDFLNKM
ncbi:NADH-quinone oxidoreductase subunit NuoN [Neobacillus vireti]|uniref:NADH-quinone oxidoreductase subunit N n=1 Tax=Neobacillus vireti LMG 21834 TaxID=1131730 RepID=A0AB94IK51_9BACI|nr:NADH-quinone oxidoreductase subunit NuoN [Neobacillus vireti]ETI67491.1 NADH:ubiquinone oxidoreductase subunit N [Neobacillus vireti LMG 21834]KLT15487.1 NADH:ubiquinone oxidoreductase subunit N [Neobacillus vireti]